MSKISLYNPWRPGIVFDIGHVKKFIHPSRLKSDKMAMKIEYALPSEEEIIEKELEESYWDQFPKDNEYLGYLLNQAEIIDKRKQRKRKKAENKGKRREKNESVPEHLKDQVIAFLTEYNLLKDEAVTTDLKKELKEFVETARSRIYRQIKKYKGLNTQVDTLIRLLSETPSI